MEQRTPVLIGYMRVSKADGSQVLDLQRDALLAAGVGAEHLYEDLASGRRDVVPRLGRQRCPWRAHSTPLQGLQGVGAGMPG